MNNILKSSKILLTDTICRICLQPCKDTISIFRKFIVDTECQTSSKTSQIMSVLELLEYVTQIKMYEQFSSMVCITCVKSAHDAFIFKTKIRKTELWLQSNISKIFLLTTNEKQLQNADDSQAIKAWLESKTSKLETDKKCDNAVTQTDSHDVKNTPESNKKLITIVKRKRKVENVLQFASKLQKKQPEDKINTKSDTYTLQTKRSAEKEKLNSKSDNNLQTKPSEEKEKVNCKSDHLQANKSEQKEKMNIKSNNLQQKLDSKSDNLQPKKSEEKEKVNSKSDNNLQTKTSEEKEKVNCKSDHLQANKSEQKEKMNSKSNNLQQKLEENQKLSKSDNLQPKESEEKEKVNSKPNNYNLQTKSSEKINSKMHESVEVGSIEEVQTELASHKKPEENKDKPTKNLVELPVCLLNDHDYNLIYCEICSEYFPGKYPYEEHKKIHTAKNFKCKYCTKKFTTFAHLTIHLKSHGRKDSLDQVLAQYTLDNNYPLYMNSKQENFFMCQVCFVVYKRFPSLTEHLTIRHVTKDKQYCCSICEQGFNKRLDLQNHLLVHTEGLPYFCVHCPKKFNKILELINHVKTHSSDAPLFRIPYDPNCIQNRKEPEPEEDDIPFLKDKKDKIYLCPHCGMKYDQRYTYKAHLDFHAGNDKAICQICGKTYRRRQLNSHMQIHNDSTPHKCELCDKAYKQKASLKHHMMTHTNQLPYKCEICGKMFKERCYLRFHMKYHNNERNYECHVCGKKYIKKGHLTAHFLTHTQERPYSCKYCDKKFRSASDCKYHVYAHENKKPFSCNVCQTSFTRPSSLREHTKVYHKTQNVL